jgi:hypothetical protein
VAVDGGIVFVDASDGVLGDGKVDVGTKSLADPVGRKPAMVGMAKRDVGRIGSPRFVWSASKA